MSFSSVVFTFKLNRQVVQLSIFETEIAKRHIIVRFALFLK